MTAGKYVRLIEWFDADLAQNQISHVFDMGLKRPKQLQKRSVHVEISTAIE